MSSIRALLKRLAAELLSGGRPAYDPQKGQLSPAPLGSVDPVRPKVLLIVFNPALPSKNNRKLSEALNWNDPQQLVDKYIADIKDCSYGYCNYQLVEKIETNGFPVKIDGFRYTADSFLTAWQTRQGFHDPDWADYDRIMADYKLAERIRARQIDEVWLFAFPYGGFYESRMVGPDAFWCNAPPLKGHDHAQRRFVIMGFNYERGVGQMLEAHGHRAESIIKFVYRRTRADDNLWERFIRYDKSHPGGAEVGTVHFAPNSQRDYDWGNTSRVPSRSDNWLNFPDLAGPPRMVSSNEWGSGDTRLHHLWWFKHFPHVAGSSNGISHNWWEYVTDPNRVR
jgi:hypothetical protein